MTVVSGWKISISLFLRSVDGVYSITSRPVKHSSTSIFSFFSLMTASNWTTCLFFGMMLPAPIKPIHRRPCAMIDMRRRRMSAALAGDQPGQFALSIFAKSVASGATRLDLFWLAVIASSFRFASCLSPGRNRFSILCPSIFRPAFFIHRFGLAKSQEQPMIAISLRACFSAFFIRTRTEPVRPGGISWIIPVATSIR